MGDRDRPRILIADGGCGGMHTALGLEELLRPGESTVMVADPRSLVFADGGYAGWRRWPSCRTWPSTPPPATPSSATGRCAGCWRRRRTESCPRSDDGEESPAGTLVWTAGVPQSAGQAGGPVYRCQGPRPYRHASAGSAASLGVYRDVAEGYGLRMRGFPAWMTHRTYHLLKLPTMNRRLRVVSDWTLALLFPREVVSLDVRSTGVRTSRPRCASSLPGRPIRRHSQVRNRKKMTTMLSTGEQQELRQIEEELRDAGHGFAWRLTVLQGMLRWAAPGRRVYLSVLAVLAAALLRLAAAAGRMLMACAEGAALMEPTALMALGDTAWQGWESWQVPGTSAGPAQDGPPADGTDLS